MRLDFVSCVSRHAALSNIGIFCIFHIFFLIVLCENLFSVSCGIAEAERIYLDIKVIHKAIEHHHFGTLGTVEGKSFYFLL